MTESKKIKNPFPGLRPFETDEYRLFFGREGQSDALIARLQRAHFLAVVGTSGSGKSSLVRAGLLPALRGGLMAGAGSGWRIAIMRPGSDPIGNLALALADQSVLLEAGGGLPLAEAEAVIESTLRQGSLGLVDVVKQARLAAHEKLLVVVDQFEELFRFRAARAVSSTGDDASAFVKLLLEASQQREFSIYVVPTMRSDFLGDCAQFQGLPEAINDGQYLIPRMTRDERRFAITGPVGVTRGKITEPLVNRLMNDVGDNPDQLPILQHALMRTWDYWAMHRLNGEPIGLEHYEAVGTMSDALSEHADEAFNELPDERSRLIAEILFKALTERGADNREIRRPTCLKDICAIADAGAQEVSAVVEVFRGGGRSFLMPPAGVALEPETVIDISHESLIRNWRRLKEWVKEEADSARIYRRLAGAATDYYARVGGLLDDVTLQYVLRWRERSKPVWAWGVRYHSEFNTAMSYLELSTATSEASIYAEQERKELELETARAFAEKQARSAQRMRRLTAALCLILLFTLGTAAYALHLRAEAKGSEKVAKGLQASAERSEAMARIAQEHAEVLQATAENSARTVKEQKDKTQNALDKVKTAVQAQEKALVAQQQATAFAKKQESKAKENLESFKLSNSRSELNVLAAAAFQREDYERALEMFRNALDILTQQQSQHVDDAGTERSLTFSQIALLSNLGATQRKLGVSDKAKFEEAVKSYETANELMSKLMAQIKQSEDIEWTLFDVYHGLAHAYRDRADELQETRRYAASRPEVNELKGKVKELNDKAEEYFKKALETQEQLLKGKDDARLATGLENLARLYSDLGKYKEAEPVYQRILKLRKKLSDEDAYVATLKTVAEFYSSLDPNLDYLPVAEEVYNQAIDIQEQYTLDRGNEISDSYSQLAQLYNVMGKKDQADNAFEVAKLLQQASFNYKRDEVKSLCRDLDALAPAYLKLHRYVQVWQIYEVAGGNSSDDCKVKNPAEAEALLNSRLAAIPTLPGATLNKQWEDEDAIYKALGVLQRRQNKERELEQVYDRRLENMRKRYGEFMTPDARTSDVPRFIAAYVKAAGEVGRFYEEMKKNDQAATAYSLAFNALSVVTGLSDTEILEEYAATLEQYQTLLIELNKPDEAAKVEEAIQGVRKKLSEIGEIRK